MYIRRTTIKSRASGEPYFTFRLVESIRVEDKVRQRTVLNLGRHFEVPREQWAAFAQRIEHIVSAQSELVPPDLDPRWEALAQRSRPLLDDREHRRERGEDPQAA